MQNRMIDIDDLLKFSSYQDIDIPQKIENRINYTLANKKRKNKGLMFAIKNIIMTIFATIIVGFTGLVVYAGFGGTINNVSVIKWFDIFGITVNNYDEFKEKVVDQKVSYDETSVELVSTLSGKLMTILEFDVKLSQKDIEYLKLGQSILSKADYEEVDRLYTRNALVWYVYGRKANDENDEKFVIEIDENGEPDIDKVSQETIAKVVKMYEEYNLNIENTYGFIPNNEDEINEFKKNAYTKENLYANMERSRNGFFNTLSLTCSELLVDGSYVHMKGFQTIQKIEDNYYKVFNLYLIPEESLEGKTSFNIEINRIFLGNMGEKISDDGKKIHMNSGANARTIDIPGTFDVEINQDKVNENTKVYENLDYNSEYKNMTNSIGKITVTPYQTIMVVKSTITGIDNDTRYYIDEETQWPMFFNYDITDKDGNSLSNMSYEVKRTMLKKNGVVENWAPGDIQAMSYFNDATIEYISYLLIENKQENTELKIVPTFEAFKRPEDVEPDTSGVVMEKMPMIKINLE